VYDVTLYTVMEVDMEKSILDFPILEGEVEKLVPLNVNQGCCSIN
jgi:hypothetical protein